MTRRALLTFGALEALILAVGPLRTLVPPPQPVLTRPMLREIDRILRLTPEQRLDEIRQLSRAVCSRRASTS